LACCAEQLSKNATATKKIMAGHRPVSVSTAREDRSDQSIPAIPKKGASRPKYQIVMK
jgi:hypothetical protein